jgi:putative nucleotidyltransferase with HDIG domain
MTESKATTDRKTLRALRASEAGYRSLFESMLGGFARCRMFFDAEGAPEDWVYLDVNPAFERLTGLTDVIGKRVNEVIPGIRETNPELFEMYGRAALTGERQRFETYVQPLGIWFSIAVFSPRKHQFVAVFENVSERKRAEWEAERTVEFLSLLNESTASTDLIRKAVSFLRLHSGCEAVGIRIRDGDDYPYYETRGFPPEFVEAETHLCVPGPDGGHLLDGELDPVLACMCGNVISGRSDPSKPFFTPGGSFWSNSTTRLLATTTDEDRLARTRNRCNGEGYESVALVPLVAGKEPLGLVQLNDKREGAFTPQTIALWERLAGYLAVALAKVRTEEALRHLTGQLEQTLTGTVRALGATTELRDPYTAGHQRRVAELSEAIAIELGWDPGHRQALHTAALLHDIGKIVVPAEILSKPGSLTSTETLLIRQHCASGAEIVAGIDFGAAVAQMILQHHERLDGSGYPGGLGGAQILPEASILAVADVVEAMISHRPYRAALSVETALQELAAGRGSRYDAAACDACLRLFRDRSFRLSDS